MSSSLSSLTNHDRPTATTAASTLPTAAPEAPDAVAVGMELDDTVSVRTSSLAPTLVEAPVRPYLLLNFTGFLTGMVIIAIILLVVYQPAGYVYFCTIFTPMGMVVGTIFVANLIAIVKDRRHVGDTTSQVQRVDDGDGQLDENEFEDDATVSENDQDETERQRRARMALSLPPRLILTA